MNARYTRKAFTLLDCVMCLTAGGLLVAALLPLMDRAREQSRLATCLSNMRTIAQGAHGYISEQGSIVFCWPVLYDPGEYVPGYVYYTEYIWGGGVPDVQDSDWDPNWGFNFVGRSDVYCYRPALRPMNHYLVPGVWWDDPERIQGNPARYERPMQLPDFFKCPSDVRPYTRGETLPDNPDIPGGTLRLNNPDQGQDWRFWGLSYPINWYWATLYVLDQGGSIVRYLAGNANTGDPGLGPELLASKLDRGASEFVLFMENRLNVAFTGVRPRGWSDDGDAVTGWHGGLNMHVAGFLDGSARYRYFDHRYVDGPGWSIWPNRPWPRGWDQP